MSDTALKIRKIREHKDYTQEFMANQLKISQSAYAQMEGGSTAINSKKLKKIAEILDVDTTSLLSSDDFTFNIHNNTLNDNASIIRELNDKQSELYERFIKDKDGQITHLEGEILFLRNQLEAK